MLSFSNLNAILIAVYIFIGIFIIFATVFFLFQQIQKNKQKNNFEIALQNSTQKINEAEQRFNKLFENASVGIALIDLDGNFFRVNDMLTKLLGYSEAEILTLNYFNLLKENALADLRIHIQNLHADKLKVYQAEQQFLTNKNDEIWLLSRLSLIKDEANNPLYFVYHGQNISAQKLAESRLKQMSYHDSLTGLANRNRLDQFVNHLLALSRRHHVGFAVMFIDLNRFKNINDTIGHEAGDLILQIIADRLNITVRNTDLVVRMGGDEFVIVITDILKSENVAQIAQKILENIMQAIVINKQELYVSASIGISLYPFDGHNLNSLIKNADLALSRSKEQGDNNYQFYTLEMTRRAQERLALQNALAHAIIKDEFTLFYQPKITVKNNKLVGMEAYLRWNNSEYGMITPGEIIAIAEESGLIIPVSEWIIESACKQLKAWHAMGLPEIKLSLNCSSRQFKQNDFVEKFFAVLNQYGISPTAIEFDVTEKIIMEDTENSLRTLLALKDLGIAIIIDNFGTGYWSLNNLRRLQIDGVKIDKSFIKYLIEDDTSATITSAIIAMAKKLEIHCIAQGVETKEQFEFLRHQGCDEMQGYYISPPMAVEPMTQYMQNKASGVETA